MRTQQTCNMQQNANAEKTKQLNPTKAKHGKRQI